jgi:hypothetical protein
MTRNLENAKKLRKEWYERNKEITKERARQWALNNPEKHKKSVDKWREENRDQHNAVNRKWSKNNKPTKATLEGKRRAAKLQRTPAWDKDTHLISAKYQLANMLTRETGTPYHVDHIIPLQGKNVCGLHVFSNLRVILGEENIKKSNKFPI